jgi:fructose-1,6-bisphosphatase/inositol monophosphatase family enzyme
VTVLTTIERAAIDGHRQPGDAVPPAKNDSDEAAIYLGIRLLLEAGQLVRERRATAGKAGVMIKEDGSPATDIEERIESRLREWLLSLGSDVVVVGEETGGTLPATGRALAIDPIDGTRAFLAETETYSTTLALIRDRKTILGMVSNPATGEIAYATATGDSRLIRLALFGEPDEAYSLRAPVSQESPLLVNMHPSRNAHSVVDALYGAWERGEIAMVRSPGGSPAWALVEAARGHFVYANLWSSRAAEAFDLAAGNLIVQRAGGAVNDLDGKPIDALRHSGPFVAGLDSGKVARLAELLRAGMEPQRSGVS